MRNSCWLRMAWLPLVMVALPSGCSRQFSVTQSDYINNAMYQYRNDWPECDGDPLEVNVVCVRSSDLRNEFNDLLRPEAGITSADWYTLRPQLTDSVSDTGHERFRLPKDQVLLYTDESRCYGKKVGPRLLGATRQKATLSVPLESGPWVARDSTVYVFPRFIGPDQEVLDVPPVCFRAGEHGGDDLNVRIGVSRSREHYGQYVAVGGGGRSDDED